MPDLNPHKENAEKIFRQSLDLHNPSGIVSRFIDSHKDIFEGDSRIDLVASGKCGLTMARGALAVLGDRIESGLIITNASGGEIRAGIKVIRSSHPVPDEKSVEAARELIEFTSTGGEDATLIYLMSGGTSAMVASPGKGIILEEKRGLTGIMMKSGIEIADLNSVRSFFSGIKGGKLLNRVRAKKIIVLVLSDVLNNDPAIIGSGLLYPRLIDPDEVISLLEKYGSPEVNPVVAKCIGIAKHSEKEIVSPDKIVEHHIIDSNQGFTKDVAILAEKLGYKGVVSSKHFTGQVESAVEEFFNWVGRYPKEPGQPIMFIAGAETGVTVKGTGRGGRNSEFAMRAAPHLAGLNSVLLAAGTDGIDGITKSAGAIIDGETYEKGEALGLNFEEMLSNNDSGTWCDSTGSSLVTGHTGVNLADVLILIKA